MTGPSDAAAPRCALERARASGLLPTGAHLLLALSGGRDSASLLHALHDVGAWPLSAAVVDHGLHPESTATAQAAAGYAERLGVAVAVLTVDARPAPGGAGPEATARALRYRSLRSHAERIGARYIVTAHTADDQAETLLMRVAEGTGLRGLAGIPPTSADLRRPWLGVARRDVGAYALAHGVPVVQDPTNTDTRYRRNAMRRTVSPALDDVFGPRWPVRAARSAEHARGAIDLLDHLLEASPGLLRRIGDRVEVPRAALALLGPAAGGALVDRALASAIGGGRRRARHIYSLLALAPGERHPLPGPWIARGTAAALVIEPATPVAAPDPPLAVEGPGVFLWSGWRFELWKGTWRADDRTVALDPVAAPLPWRVRVASPAERLRPRGALGHKALRRLWSDAGVSARWRAALPVIESAGRAVWAAGLRAAEHARVVGDGPVWCLMVTEPVRGPGLAGPEGSGGACHRPEARADSSDDP